MAIDSFGQVMDTMDFVKRAWSTFNLPSPFTPTLSVEELDKRIADLRTVEQWLALNQNMLRSTIQGLEIQRSTLSAVWSMSDSFGKALNSAQPQASELPVPAGQPGEAVAAAANPLAWWNLLQSNFQQIAEAVAGAGAASASGLTRSPGSAGGVTSAARITKGTKGTKVTKRPKATKVANTTKAAKAAAKSPRAKATKRRTSAGGGSAGTKTAQSTGRLDAEAAVRRSQEKPGNP